jgi:hypothetical protein
VPMVFLNLRGGSKAGLPLRSKHASRRSARARFRAESRQRTRVGLRIAGDYLKEGAKESLCTLARNHSVLGSARAIGTPALAGISGSTTFAC